MPKFHRITQLMTLHEAAQRIGGDVDQLDVEGAIDAGLLHYYALTESTIRVDVADVDRVGPSISHERDDEDDDDPRGLADGVE